MFSDQNGTEDTTPRLLPIKTLLWDLTENQNLAWDVSASFPEVFNSCGELGREVEGKNTLPGNPDVKALAVGKNFVLTAY